MNNKDGFEKTITLNTSSVWIGDPLYALSFEQFVELCDNDGPIILDGTEIGIVHRTQGGDGAYSSSKGREYLMESAKLSIIDGNFVNEYFHGGDSMINLEEGLHTITLIYENGTFTFKVDGNEIERIEIN